MSGHRKASRVHNDPADRSMTLDIAARRKGQAVAVLVRTIHRSSATNISQPEGLDHNSRGHRPRISALSDSYDRYVLENPQERNGLGIQHYPNPVAVSPGAPKDLPPDMIEQAFSLRAGRTFNLPSGISPPRLLAGFSMRSYCNAPSHHHHCPRREDEQRHGNDAPLGEGGDSPRRVKAKASY